MALVATIASASRGTSVASVPMAVSTPVPAGSTLIGSVVVDAATPTNPTLTVTDARGNSYTIDGQRRGGTTVSTSVFSCRVTTGLQAGDLITVTAADGTRGRWAITVQAFTDILEPRLDRVASNDAVASTLASGTTATTSSASELVYAAFGYGGGRALTPAAGWDASAQVVSTAGTSDRAVSALWRSVHTAGPQTATATLSSSSTYAGVIATYRSAPTNSRPTAVAGPDQTVDAWSTVTLDATGSTDSDGTITGYAWTQIQGPAVALSDASAPQPTFTAPGIDGGTTVVFSLTVADNAGGSSTNTATTTVTIRPAVHFLAHASGWAPIREYSASAGTWR